MSAIPPVLLERTCDGGKSSMDASQIVMYAADLVKQHGEAFMLSHPYFPGCGTRFQWYGLGNCYCPECGRQYQVMMQDVKSGVYAVK
jgi:hypothetical protein